MRRLAFIVFCFVLFTLANCFAQGSLSDKYSFKVSNKTISAALLDLAELSQININFNPEIIPKHLRVSIFKKESNVLDIVRSLLRGTNLKFEILNKQIIVFAEVTKIRKYRISGIVENKGNGERLLGANVYDLGLRHGSITNEEGFFSVSMPEGQREIIFSFLGFEPQKFNLDLHKNEIFYISLEPSITLAEILIFDNDSIDNGLINHSIIQLNRSELENLIGVGGENDIFGQIRQIAGVQSGPDGLGGLNIRGGSEDQNLLVVDGSPVYYPNHLFGVFSSINSEALKTGFFSKNNFISARGKRLSSEIGIKLKSGNMKKNSGSLAANISSIKGSLEGPISTKSSISIAGRKSLRPQVRIFSVEDFRSNGNTLIDFHDIQFKFKSLLSEKSSISISGIQGSDIYNYSLNHIDSSLSIREDRDYDWSNWAGNIRWTYLINHQLYLNSTWGFSRFRFDTDNVSSFTPQLNESRRKGSLLRSLSLNKDIFLNFDFDLYINAEHFTEFGIGISNHQFNPNLYFVNDTTAGDFIGPDYSAENILTFNGRFFNKSSFRQLNVYAEHHFSIGKLSRLQLGLFSTLFQGDKISKYYILPKVSFQHRIISNLTWSIYGQKSSQHFHKIDIDPATYPNSIWLPISNLVHPKSSWLISSSIDLVMVKGFNIRLESYYNWLSNQVIFPSVGVFSPGQSDFERIDIENLLLSQSGKSYGLEVSVSKYWRYFNFNLNYTLSKTTRETFDDDRINVINRYPYSRRHLLNLSTSYNPHEAWRFNGVLTYGSGNAALYSHQRFQNYLSNYNLSSINNYEAIYGNISNKNIRVDFNTRFTIGTSPVHMMTIGAYNILNRKNELYRFVDIDPKEKNLNKIRSVSSLGRRLTINYRFSF